MKKKGSKVIVLFVIFAVIMAGCSKKEDSKETTKEVSITSEITPTTKQEVTNNPTSSPTEQVTETPVSSDTYMFKDSCGREVELPKNIERIAPSGSLAQIVLFAIAPDKFVGLSSNWADESQTFLSDKYLALPVFGQFYGSGNLNMEALAAANPQVIIDIGEAKDSVVEDMNGIQEQLGIPTIFIEATTETMGECYKTLGELLGLEKEGQKLQEYCDTLYESTFETMKGIGEDEKVKLVYCVGETGTNVIAKGSFHAEILDLLGDNVAVVDDVSNKGSGNEVSLEQLYLWDPDVILFAPGSVYASVGEDTAWNGLKAISSGNYYEVPYGPYNWMGFPPSVNRYLGMLWLSNLLYPDQFSYNLEEKVKEYYELFYHCELTSEQYKELVKNAIK